jgi:hypothetical protein
MINRSGIGAIGLLFILGFSVIMIIFAVVIWWKIFSKAGYSGAMGLLMFIPIVNLIALLILAFGEWPIQREVQMLRQQLAQQSQGYPGQGVYQQQGYYPPPVQGNPRTQ